MGSLEDGNVWLPLVSGYGQERQEAGRLHLDIQLPRKHKKGMTFRAAKGILNSASSDDLAALKISDGAAASKGIYLTRTHSSPLSLSFSLSDCLLIAISLTRSLPLYFSLSISFPLSLSLSLLLSLALSDSPSLALLPLVSRKSPLLLSHGYVLSLSCCHLDASHTIALSLSFDSTSLVQALALSFSRSLSC